MRLDENILRIKEVMGLITEAEQPKVFEINLGNLFDSGKYILNQQAIASINGAILKLRDFAKKTPTTPVVVSVESSESKVPNYDREKYPSTGDRNVDFADDKKLGVGALSTLRAKSIEDYLNKTLRIPNAKIDVVNKGAQGPSWDGKNANDPKYTANQYVKLLAKLESSVPTKTQPEYTKITKDMILTGSYYCDGMNSERITAVDNTINPWCNLLPKNLWDRNHISGFEIKWNTNVVKDPYVEPLTRWVFVWGKDGKIKQIRKIDNIKTNGITEGKPVPLNDPELIYYMNLNAPGRYEKYVKPYI
jgi:outer membrane protein OmpA-like peptidoglycan-associated protein